MKMMALNISLKQILQSWAMLFIGRLCCTWEDDFAFHVQEGTQASACAGIPKDKWKQMLNEIYFDKEDNQLKWNSSILLMQD